MSDLDFSLTCTELERQYRSSATRAVDDIVAQLSRTEAALASSEAERVRLQTEAFERAKEDLRVEYEVEIASLQRQSETMKDDMEREYRTRLDEFRKNKESEIEDKIRSEMRGAAERKMREVAPPLSRIANGSSYCSCGSKSNSGLKLRRSCVTS